MHFVTTYAALTMRFAENTRRDTSAVVHLPRNMKMDCAYQENCNSSSDNIAQGACACHAKRLSTRYRTNVTKCHACHGKRGLPLVKSDPFCRSFAIGTAIRPSCERLWTAATVANGCGERTNPQPADPQRKTRTFATHSGKCTKRWLGFQSV